MTQPPTSSVTPSDDRTGTPTDSSAAAATGHPQFPITLVNASKRNRKLIKPPGKLLRKFRTAFRSFPIFSMPSAVCQRLTIPLPGSSRGGAGITTNHISGSKRLTGTLFGHRKARITFSIQDNPRSVPILLLELTIPTAKFMTDIGSSGSTRVALECEKKADQKGCKIRLLNEPIWTSFINGKTIGYGTRREPTENDLKIMQMLHATSMGAGVLTDTVADAADGELTYMRAHFDRVVGSKDSETYYMLNPDGNTGSELSIFFVRI